MKKTLERIIVIMIAAFLFVTGMWLGIAVTIHSEVEEELVTVGEVGNNPISTGDVCTEIYTIELWDDNSARVITTQQYIKRISESTVVISSKPNSEIIEELQQREW